MSGGGGGGGAGAGQHGVVLRGGTRRAFIPVISSQTRPQPLLFELQCRGEEGEG